MASRYGLIERVTALMRRVRTDPDDPDCRPDPKGGSLMVWTGRTDGSTGLGMDLDRMMSRRIGVAQMME